MSWIERVIEERLARAAASGELDTPHLKGRPLPDLDRPREPGWWADAAAAEARAGFWRAPTADELRDLVRSANAAIAKANLNLVMSDHLPLFDWSDVRDRWEQLRR
jgi:hypothetical protein